MPLDALYSAATGMLAQQTSMDTIANNLSNVNTTGFKRGRTAFADLLYTQLTPQQAAKQGNQVGLGTRVAGVQTEFEEGAFQDTGQPYDLAIEGDGFFEITKADGSKAYTRTGNFDVDSTGQLVTVTGEKVSPAIKVPPGATNVTIAPEGKVSATVNGRVQALGQLRVATFANSAGLESAGDNLYRPSVNSGAAQLRVPGQGGAGTLRQGTLEGSNVNAVDEMVGMITTQRAYEAVAKVVTASDEMLQLANQLRRG